MNTSTGLVSITYAFQMIVILYCRASLSPWNDIDCSVIVTTATMITIDQANEYSQATKKAKLNEIYLYIDVKALYIYLYTHGQRYTHTHIYIYISLLSHNYIVI